MQRAVLIFVTAALASAQISLSPPNTVPRPRVRPGQLSNASLVDLIATAHNVEPDAVIGGPEWIASDRWDVATDSLQSLLADRFRLTVHKSTQDRPALALTIAKRHSLKPAAQTDGTCRGQRTPRLFACRNMTMAALAAQLPGLTGYASRIVDRTGLAGAWDFDLPLDAMQELGLKLTPIKLPTPVIIVDRAERPTGVTQLPAPEPKFEVATIKPWLDDRRGSNVAVEPNGNVHIGMTLKGLIQEAWGDLSPHRVLFSEKDAGSESYWRVDAKAAFQPNTPEGWSVPVWNGLDIHSMRMMLRALLVERFHLQAHIEERMIDGYALTAYKPKLRKADPGNRPACAEGPGPDGKDPRTPLAPKLVTCRNLTLAQFAEKLSAWSPEDTILFGFPPVVDPTNLAGRYDLTIHFTPPQLIERLSPEDSPILIFEALNKLGLKLESRKVKTQVLVIDHVDEVPSEN